MQAESRIAQSENLPTGNRGTARTVLGILAVSVLLASAAAKLARAVEPERVGARIDASVFESRLSVSKAITLASVSLAATPAAKVAAGPAAQPPNSTYGDRYFPVGYFSLKLGPHEFVDESDDSNTAFWSEGIFGYTLGENFALETGLGYLSGNGTGRVDFDYYAFPFLFGGRFIAPLGRVSLHAGANVAMYLFKVRAEDDATNRREHDSTVLFGGGLSAGVNFDVGNGGYLGAEVKYTNTGQTTLDDRSYDLDGIAVMFVSGIRF